MGIIDWLQKKAQEEVIGTRVLVGALGAKFEDVLAADTEVWRRHYPSLTMVSFSNIHQLIERVSRRYDIIHLGCEVLPDGNITDTLGGIISGADLIARCCESDVRLLWIASGNPPEGYIKGFKAKGKRINLVMTIDRHGAKFPKSLDGLLSRMSNGERMESAWVSLWPQVPGAPHPDAPDAIFFSGWPGVVLLG